MADLGIDCGWQETGERTVATRPHELEELRVLAGEMTAAGHEVELLDAAAVRAEVDSPTYLGGLRERRGTALVEPARLAWGLRRACLAAGVTIHERTRVSGLARDGAGLRAPPRTARRCAPGGWPWPPTPSRRCCVGSGWPPCRSTTTC